MVPDERRSARPVIWLVLAAGVLLLAVELVVPALIAQAYRGESLEILNGILQGRAQRTLADYLRAWEGWSRTIWQLMVVLVGVAVLWQWKVAALARPILARQPVMAPWQVLWVAAWFGALAGFAEAALLLRDYGGHPARGFAWERVWMAPLASILAFLLVTLTLLLVTRASGGAGKWLQPVSIRTAVFVVCGLATYAVVGRSQFHLSTYAAVILSSGLAAVIARFSSSDGVRLMRVVRITSIPVAALLVITSASGVWMLPMPLEQRRLAALRPVSGRPNILLIVLDTQRATSMSLYGYERETTPHLSRFARRGVVFDRAIAPAPWTLPSHASMFTGRYPHEMTADIGIPLDKTHRTIAEVLTAEGYATAAFPANLSYTTEASGLARGFARYEDYPISIATFVQSSWLAGFLVGRPLNLAGRPGRKPDETVTNDFLRWHATHADAPYFAFLNYMGAHSPYPQTGAFKDPGQLPSNVPKREGITSRELEGARAAYDNAIANTDREIGRLLSEIDRRGALEHTVVVVTADHGEHLGEHGLQEHTNSLYMPLLHVPLVIVYPRTVSTGTRVTTSVTLRDIPATLLELTGVTSRNALAGKSLSRHWESDPGTTPDEPILSELNYWGKEQGLIKQWDPVYAGSMKSLILDDLHYIRGGRGEEVFNLAVDPDEESNLKDSLDIEVLVRLRAALDSILHRP